MFGWDLISLTLTLFRRKNKKKSSKMVGVPGTAGRDYPTYTSIPMTR